MVESSTAWDPRHLKVTMKAQTVRQTSVLYRHHSNTLQARPLAAPLPTSILLNPLQPVDFSLERLTEKVRMTMTMKMILQPP